MTTNTHQPERATWPRLILRRADQAVAASFVALSLAAIAGWCIWQGQLRGRSIDIERAEPIAIDFKIDVNKAEWPELALMPNIGEQLAKRIVADRAERGAFREIGDLRRVRGIGPKTLESMQPFLLPLPNSDATAETNSPSREPVKVN
ncbi:MAG TPA: helix-hairpin-helix domain-containing protein [Pirellulaceae bacterium]|nr:helix-hairpin-helix domain-containing protein [Pirellulaceae bacterium]